MTRQSMSQTDIQQALEDHMGFIIQTVSQRARRYVHIQDDDLFSHALQAFQEACQRYEPDRGSFLPFAKQVINSRITDYQRKEGRHRHLVSLEAIQEEGVQLADPETVDPAQEDLRLEIEAWKASLAQFQISLEDLAGASPRHTDTRQRALAIGEKTSQDPPIVQALYRKKKLPIRATARLNQVSEKVVQGSKTFITGVVVVFVEEFKLLVDWMKRG